LRGNTEAKELVKVQGQKDLNGELSWVVWVEGRKKEKCEVRLGMGNGPEKDRERFERKNG
jgi:hypothetical protein